MRCACVRRSATMGAAISAPDALVAGVWRVCERCSHLLPQEDGAVPALVSDGGAPRPRPCAPARIPLGHV